MKDNPTELKSAIESQHGGKATFIERARVKEEFNGQVVWDGTVLVFDLDGNPGATRAYAWSSPIESSSKRRYFAVLHAGPVDSPQAAVRAAIIAEHRK